ncbi:MAG: OsmC family protein [Dehalococcoidia bacterium]
MATEQADVRNGIDWGRFEEALTTVGAEAKNARAPKASRVRWLGGLKLKVGVRNHTFLVDEPSHLTGEDEAPNAVEYVLGAYGACLATGLILNAARRNIELRNLELSLESTQDNAFSFMGINDEGHSGIDEVKVKLYVQADADEAALREVWEHTLRTSPVGNTLVREVRVTPELQVIP